MVPLYVRSTLVEANGTSPGGDQTFDMMATDRRYTHYMGRVLNRFEEAGNSAVDKSTSSGYGQSPKRITATTTAASTASTGRKDSLATMGSSHSNIITHDPKKHSGTGHLSPAALSKEEKHAQREERRKLAVEMKKAKETPLTHSLVRLVFKNPEPSLADLNYLDEL